MERKSKCPLFIRINDFQQDGTGVTYFKICVHDRETTNKWDFEERYSFMRELHKSLRQQFQGELPDFPPKKWFGNTDQNFLSQRSASLQTYFNNILNHIQICNYPSLINFFYRNSGQPVEQSTEQDEQKKRAKTFAKTMERIIDKIKNRFIANITDLPLQMNEQTIDQQKRMQLNQIRFNLKSQYLSTYSLPSKYEKK